MGKIIKTLIDYEDNCGSVQYISKETWISVCILVVIGWTHWRTAASRLFLYQHVTDEFNSLHFITSCLLGELSFTIRIKPSLPADHISCSNQICFRSDRATISCCQ